MRRSTYSILSSSSSDVSVGAGSRGLITAKPSAGYEVDTITVTDAEVTKAGDGKYTFEMPEKSVEINVTFRKAAQAFRFLDVAEGAWYYDAVYYCYDNGYFYGTSDDRFTPDGTMTRAMFATVLYRIAGEPKVKGTSAFADVEAGTWYTDAVIWATGEKIIEGYGNGIFGTNDPITREQMVTLFWRYNGKPAAKNADLSIFTDADKISDWAKDAFEWSISVGVINGKGGGILDPKGTATRAEVAQIVMNYGVKI